MCVCVLTDIFGAGVASLPRLTVSILPLETLRELQRAMVSEAGALARGLGASHEKFGSACVAAA